MFPASNVTKAFWQLVVVWVQSTPSRVKLASPNRYFWGFIAIYFCTRSQWVGSRWWEDHLDTRLRVKNRSMWPAAKTLRRCPTPRAPERLVIRPELALLGPQLSQTRLDVILVILWWKHGIMKITRRNTAPHKFYVSFSENDPIGVERFPDHDTQDAHVL